MRITINLSERTYRELMEQVKRELGEHRGISAIVEKAIRMYLSSQSKANRANPGRINPAQATPSHATPKQPDSFHANPYQSKPHQTSPNRRQQ